MRKHRVQKGQYGYMNYQKKYTLIRTCLYFGISLLLFLLGLWSTGTSKNYLTVVAVLGCLPSSKSLVNVIMFLRARECSERLHEQIKHSVGELDNSYDMLLTSYERNYPLSHIVIRGGNVCGITESTKCDPVKAEEHLRTWFKQNAFQGMDFKVFTDSKKYVERLEQLQKLEKSGQEQAQIALVKNLSL